MPSRLQRLKRSKQVCQGPYLSGRSRQGEPVRSFQRIPLMMVRWSLHWPPLWPYSGKSGSICRQARSVISPRLTMTFSPVVAHFSDYGIPQTRVSRQTCPSRRRQRPLVLGAMLPTQHGFAAESY